MYFFLNIDIINVQINLVIFDIYVFISIKLNLTFYYTSDSNKIIFVFMYFLDILKQLNLSGNCDF